MNTSSYPLCTAFEGHRRIASGSLDAVALSVKKASRKDASEAILVFEDATGHVIDLDLRGSRADIIARLPRTAEPDVPSQATDGGTESPMDEPRGRGRPKLGVVAREVTLLPRHWDWLASQPGGASIALRKLVESARRSSEASDRARRRMEAGYRFMSAMAGNLPGFEEATRSLFSNDRARFESFVAKWPADVRTYAIQLAFTADEGDAHEYTIRVGR